jgi:hypothetical protein
MKSLTMKWFFILSNLFGLLVCSQKYKRMIKDMSFIFGSSQMWLNIPIVSHSFYIFLWILAAYKNSLKNMLIHVDYCHHHVLTLFQSVTSLFVSWVPSQVLF